MGSEEPNENAKCMDIENSMESNGHDGRNGVGKWNFQKKLREANPDERRKWLLVLLSGLLLVFFLVIIIMALKVNSTSSDFYGRCYTPECLRSAAYIVENMDQSVNPCQDFQRFACGGFLARNPLNQSMTRVSLVEAEARGKLRTLIKRIVDEIGPEQQESSTSIRSHLAKFLGSCLDGRAASTVPDVSMISNIRDIGGWEAISATSFEKSSWKFDQALISLMKEYAVFPFFKVEVTSDAQPQRTPMIKISPSGFGLGANPDNYDQQQKPYLMRAYVKFINRAIDTLKDRNKDIYTSDLGRQIFFFEERLLQSSRIPTGGNFTMDVVSRTVSELRAYAPNILWLDVLSSLFPDANIDDRFRVLIEDEDYFRNLGQILSTSREDIKNNYMIWHFVKDYAPYLNKEIREAEATFRAEIAGGHLTSFGFKDILNQCLDTMIDYFGLGLVHIVRDELNASESIRKADEMFGNIGHIAQSNLKNVEWLHDSQFHARDRLERLAVTIGYPAMAGTESEVTNYYKRAQTNRVLMDNIFEQKRLRNRWMSHAMDKRKESRYQTQIARQLLAWKGSPLDIEPYYSYEMNQLIVPMGFLIDPIFSAAQNPALQIAALARVAQEAMKSVDGYGLQYKDFGTTANSTFDALKERLKCLEEQTENELHTRGILNKFVDEALTDIAGLHVAIEALKRQGDILKLPGLDYEAKQLFYIAYGQLMCESLTDTRTVYQNGTLTSAPGRLRLHRTLQQTPDFADAFGCPASSKMVPLKVCEVW